MKKFYLAILLMATFFFAPAQPTIGFTPAITGLTAPVDIVNAKDGSNRLFIVQQNGIVRVYSGNSLLSAPFLNMSSIITYSGEQGLLSLAFHPQYATNGYFFVFYNNTGGSVELAQYHVSSTDPNAADPASRKVLLTIAKPYANHNGAKLNFGPDGHLYFGTGDGGSGSDPLNNAQNLNSLLGKMIRINVDNFTVAPYYTVPSSNPLVGVAGTRPEIYSWGLRNPWRWNFDRQTGDMWIADVGQGAWEEVNMAPAASTSGLNYGWRCYEGTHTYDLSQCGVTPAADKTYPVFEYGHNAAGGISITGGLVYRGTEYPSLQGWYICADFAYSNGWIIKPNGTGGYITATQANYPANISTFGDAEDGTLYLAAISGTIYKITATPVTLPVKLLSFGARVQATQDVITWRATSDEALTRFEVEQAADGVSFSTAGTVLPGRETVSDYSFTTAALLTDRYYRLKIVYSTGHTQYSAAVRLLAAPAAKITVIAVAQKSLQLTTPVAVRQANLYNMQGQQLQSFKSLSAGTHLLDAGGIASGIYSLQCIRQDGAVENLRLLIR